MLRLARKISGGPALRCNSQREHASYLESVAATQAPNNLPCVLAMLSAMGWQECDPAARAGLHPFIVPLAEKGDTKEVIGVLVWPQPKLHKDMTSPIVAMARGAPRVRLCARSADEWIKRQLCEEDVKGESTALQEAAGNIGLSLYKSGDYAKSGLSRLDAFMTRSVGLFPDVCENLAAHHFANGDQMSGLIAAEWYMKSGAKFPGWGRPFEFNAMEYLRLGRDDEARDTMKMALNMQPWWTLHGDFGTWIEVAKLAGPGPADVIKRLKEEKEVAEMRQGMHKEPRTPEEIALEEAAAVMNIVGAAAPDSADADWAGTVPELVRLYGAAGLAEFARFVEGAR
ncbi:unnamed protein product [Pedinophyceae sp. YPF-701]|nr:unnamed protein product [Pedinophyceae sp. YPF-701]